MIFNSTREKFIFYYFPVTLFILTPFFLITGPFLSDFSISLIGILFLIYCFNKKNLSFFKNKYFYFFLIFWIYLIFNSLINNINFDSLKISIFYFRYGIFVVAMVALLNKDHKFIKYFYYCIIICFTALILDGYYQYFVGENILGFKTVNNFRVSSFFNDELILGSYLSRIWPIFFGIYILMFNSKNKLFLFTIAIFVLSQVLIFLSGDRSAFFLINLSAIFVIVFSKKLLKLRLITLLLSIFFIIIISIINPTAKERLVDHSLNDMNLFGKNANEQGKKYIFSKQYTSHYITAYRMFLDNKIIGVGVKNFRNFCGNEAYELNELSCSTHPHNSYIQILSETGIIGFSFLIIILFYFCKYILKHAILRLKGKYYFSDFEVCILSGIVLYLWPIVPTGNVFNNWLNIAMILNIPFLIWSRKLIKLKK